MLTELHHKAWIAVLLIGAAYVGFFALSEVAGQEPVTNIGTKQTTLSNPEEIKEDYEPNFVLRNDTGAAINDLEICSPKPKDGEQVQNELEHVDVYRGNVPDPAESIIDESNVKRVEYTDPDRVPETTPIADKNPSDSGVSWNAELGPDDLDWDTHCVHVSFDEIPPEDDLQTNEDERVFTLQIRLESDFRGGGRSIITVRPTVNNLFLAQTFTFTPAPGTMLASATPNQGLGEIVITELVSDTIQSGIIQISPQTSGVLFSGSPFVEILGGNLQTEGAYIQDGIINIPVVKPVAKTGAQVSEPSWLVVVNVQVDTSENFSESAQAYVFANVSGASVDEESFVIASTRASIPPTSFIYLPVTMK